MPKVTIQVVDRFSTAPPQIVDNVPLGLAMLGSLTTSVANTLTELTETVLQRIPGPGGAQMPEELAYSKHGMVFGNRVVNHTATSTFNDPLFRTDIINYLRNCTFPDLANSYIKPQDWQTSTNVWALLNDSNPARFTTIRLTNGKLDVVPCPDAYRTLDARMPANVETTKAQMAYALNVGLDPQSAVTRIDPQIERAYATLRISEAARGAADLIRQNAMINAVRDAHLVQNQAMNDPAAMMLALARAQGVAAANVSMKNSASIQAQSMPVIRSSLEFALYALFPFVVLMILMSYGKTALTLIKSYAYVAIWIQLWPPMFAVVNYLITLNSAQELAAAARMTGGASGLALYTADTIYSASLSSSAIVSSMFVAVPIMAAAIVWGAERLVSFAGASVSSAQRPMDNASSQASSGNANFGNVTADQLKQAPMQQSPYMSQQQDVFGTMSRGIGASAENVMRYNATISQLPTTVSMGMAESQKFSESSKQSLAFSEQQSEKATESRAAALAEAMSIQSQYNTSSERTAGSSATNSTREGKALNEMMEVSKNVNRMLGLSEDSTVGRTLTGTAGLGGSLNLNKTAAKTDSLKSSAGEKGSSASETSSYSSTSQGRLVADLKGSAEAKSTSSQKMQEAFDYARGALEKAGVTNAKEVADAFQQSNAYSWAKRSGVSGASGFDASMRESSTYEKSSVKSLQESEEQARMSEAMRDWTNRTESNASNWIAQEMWSRGLLDKYKRADPEEQMAIVSRLAKAYAEPGGGEVNGKWRPNAGLGVSPSTVPNWSEKNRLRELYGDSKVGGSSAQPDAAWSGYKGRIGGMQDRASVRPESAVQDDVGASFAAGAARTAGAVSGGEARVVGGFNKRVEDYNEGTDPGRRATGHNAVDNSPDNVANRVSGPTIQTGGNRPQTRRDSSSSVGADPAPPKMDKRPGGGQWADDIPPSLPPTKK
jgi:conjugal transfer mating pair stabilization protein TraG